MLINTALPPPPSSSVMQEEARVFYSLFVVWSTGPARFGIIRAHTHTTNERTLNVGGNAFILAKQQKRSKK